MTVRSLPWLALAMLCMVAASAALAEPQRQTPRERSPQPKPRPVASDPCAVFGPGFVRMSGSDTCIKLGGATSIGGGVGGH